MKKTGCNFASNKSKAKMKMYYGMLASLCLLCSCRQETAEKEIAGVRVKTQKMAETPLSGSQGFSGTVEGEKGTILSFPIPGTVETVHVNVGQKLGKGALIATLDDASVANSYEMAKAAREQAEDAHRRMKQLKDSNSLPEIQWTEVESQLKQAVAAEQVAAKNLSDCRLYAPSAGVVAEKSVEPGQNVMPGMQIVKLVDIRRVKVKISVPEGEMAAIEQGGSIDMHVKALGKSFTGKVVEKGVEANALSRSYTVKALVDNPDGLLMPGMICDVNFRDGGDRKGMVLPNGVVQLDEANRTFVWVNDGGVARKRIVRTGMLVAQGVVVIDGLAVGDEAIVSGSRKISDGMKIEVVK